MEIEDGGPAFPNPQHPQAYLVRKGSLPDVVEFKPGDVLPIDSPGFEVTGSGMSLRDWFAGQALAGICAHRNASSGVQDISKDWNDVLAKAAYHAADAMIAARKNKPKET